MSEIDLVVFDLAGTTVRDADHSSSALSETLATLGLPIPAAEIESLGGTSMRDTIEDVLLRYSPEQAKVETIDRLFADFNQRLKTMQRDHGVRGVEGAEEVFHWLRGRKIKVALTTGFDRKTANKVLVSLGWNSGVADTVLCSDDVKTGRPAPYLIFRAMELTGAVNVKRVAVVGDTVLDLEAGANARVGMNVGVCSGGQAREKLEAAPHTHLIESVRKFPPLLAGAATASMPGMAAVPAPAPTPPAPAPKPPTTPTPPAPPTKTDGGQNPDIPGFTSGSNFPT